MLVASGVLFATFFYVFNDFLNVQVAALSKAMRDHFASYASYAVWLLAVALAARGIRRERVEERTVSAMARALGEAESTVRAYLALQAVFMLTVWHGLAWLLVVRLLMQPSAKMAFVLEAAMIGASLALSRMPARPARQRKSASLSLDLAMRLLGDVAGWRFAQLVFGNRAARLALVLGLVFLALAALAAHAAAPLFVAAAAALAGGIVASTSLAFQMAEDLQVAWTERSLGVTHDQFLGAYQLVGFVLGSAALLLGFVATFTALTPLDALKVGVLAALPLGIAPLILLTIDGRKPAVNVLITLIVATFVGTAVLAHWLSLALLPLLRHYALKTSAGRFYRA